MGLIPLLRKFFARVARKEWSNCNDWYGNWSMWELRTEKWRVSDSMCRVCVDIKRRKHSATLRLQICLSSAVLPIRAHKEMHVDSKWIFMNRLSIKYQITIAIIIFNPLCFRRQSFIRTQLPHNSPFAISTAAGRINNRKRQKWLISICIILPVEKCFTSASI